MASNRCIEALVDWKGDVDPNETRRRQYREQLRDYMEATGARIGLIVYMTRGEIDEIGGAVD